MSLPVSGHHMNNQPAGTATAPLAVFTETRMTAQISQIRTVADGTTKFMPTEQNGGSARVLRGSRGLKGSVIFDPPYNAVRPADQVIGNDTSK